MATSIVTPELELITVDASTVTLEDNIRDHVDTTDEAYQALLASVREHGVLVPTLGYRSEDGTIRIRAGQRRLLAARETGQPLPVVVADHGNSTAERIIAQLIENDMRADITPAQRVRAWSQLELEGLSVPKIAKAVGQHHDRVAAALTVSRSEQALKILEAQPIDLLHLAATLEFEDDPTTYAELVDRAVDSADQFEHYLERARQQRERRRVVLAHEAQLIEAGKAVYRQSELPEDVQVARASSLARQESIEPTAGGDPDVRIAVSISYSGDVIETPMMVNYAGYGYDYVHHNSGQSNAGPMTDEQKAARKLLSRRNKEWAASEVVRVRWLGEFLSRKTFPKNCASFIAVSLSRFGYDIGTRGQSLSIELLGLEPSTRGRQNSPLAERVLSNPATAGVVTLAIILGQHETGTSKETWRYPTAEFKHYLLQLESWGYSLSPVEKIAAGYEVSDDEGASLTDDAPGDFDEEPTDNE